MSARGAVPARRASHRLVATAACAALALAGCAAASDPSAQPSTTPSSGAATGPSSSAATGPSSSAATGPSSSAATAPTPTPAVRTIAISVRGRSVTPAPAVVELRRGQTLRLVVTSDHDDALHAHGFEAETELTAGTPATIELTGDQPGRYEVETHHPALRLLVVQVR